jgi:hypothetical protein
LTRVKDTLHFSGEGSAVWTVLTETRQMQKSEKQRERAESSQTNRVDAGMLLGNNYHGKAFVYAKKRN